MNNQARPRRTLRSTTAVNLILFTTLVTGCATTRVAHLLPLVTVVVSSDRAVVERECNDSDTVAATLGCERFSPVRLQDGSFARAVRLVRYADTLPSTMALEIDVHEMCHAVASVQRLADPCHIGNGGKLQAGLR
jgi:hypothetical protein